MKGKLGVSLLFGAVLLGVVGFTSTKDDNSSVITADIAKGDLVLLTGLREPFNDNHFNAIILLRMTPEHREQNEDYEREFARVTSVSDKFITLRQWRPR